MKAVIPILCVGLTVTACVKDEPTAPDAPKVVSRGDACFAQEMTPARYETVTSQVLVAAAVRDDQGRVVAPARYRTQTQQRVVTPRKPIEFRTPCEADLTKPFVQMIQRALAARAVYSGPEDGVLTPQTKRAIRLYQQSFGLDSATLSLEGAQRLGLISLSQEQLDAASNGQGDPFNVVAQP